MTYLGQLDARYDLADELSFLNPGFQADAPRHNEKIYPECKHVPLSMSMMQLRYNVNLLDPHHTLRVPYRPTQVMPKEIIQKVAVYFGQVLGKRRVDVERHVPQRMSIWGKFRIQGGGDAFRSSFAMKGKERMSHRNCSYIRVSNNIF